MYVVIVNTVECEVVRTTDIKDVRSIESEAGVIASILLKPELTFYSEALKPNHFSEKQNAYIYYAVSELAKRGIEKIDAYNLRNFLDIKEATRNQTADLTANALNELIDLSPVIARNSVEDYMIIVDIVLDTAYKRRMYKKLMVCQQMCLAENVDTELEQKIYKAIDDVSIEFSSTRKIPQYKDVIDELWSEIEERQKNGLSGIPFKFKTLNNYATIEAGELFLFGAGPKEGKSMMLLNCAVDLLRQNKAVFYLDSELNSRLFTCRLLSHLTSIPFGRIKNGLYTKDEAERIFNARQWLKSRRFTHLYMPSFDVQSVYTAAKKVKHTQGIDVLIVDYFKSKSDGDAFDTYAELGRLTDMVKNQICGDMDIAGLGAAQATDSGKLADSAKISRNASTIAILKRKTPEEIEADGVECGNKKLQIIYNRNGEQMVSGEYIDLQFNGNNISFEEAKQHTSVYPY